MSPNDPMCGPGSEPGTVDEEHELSALPTSTPALWALLADVLQALQRAGEGPRLEGAHDWRLQPTDHSPGIRRTPEHGTWQGMVTWNSDGACRWTAVQGGSWQWPGLARLAAAGDVADQARTLLERDEAYANGDRTDSSGGLDCDAWDLLKKLVRAV
ncbi:hypothetical protein [Streptomyces umbrinus]|uniref:hypothetical protein n=1 Tax=Streptomyces umbrinus TaxID=67370 RepID=UPI0033F181F5